MTDDRPSALLEVGGRRNARIIAVVTHAFTSYPKRQAESSAAP